MRRVSVVPAGFALWLESQGFTTEEKRAALIRNGYARADQFKPLA
jgi:hypothetical protein